MSTKVNFTLVGIFLFTFCIAIIGFVFWLGKYGNKTAQMDTYKIYLYESVAGLNIQSSIKFKGLDVGVVKDIRINPNNSEQIEVIAEIRGGTPIKTDTKAVLEAQGITGLKYINLEGGLKDSKLLKTSSKEIPIIKSEKSLLGNLGDSAQDISVKVNEVLNKINYLLNKKNMDNISTLIEDAGMITKNIDGTITNMDKNISSTLNRLEGTLKDIQTLVSKDAKVTMESITDASSKIAEASNVAKVTFEKLNGDINSGKFDLEKISENSLRKLDKLTTDFDRTINNANRILEKYADSPGDMIFKIRTDKFGPGERDD